jgi:peptide chain release factor 2
VRNSPLSCKNSAIGLTRSEAIFDLAKVEEEIAALDKRMARHDFWDQVDEAQEILKRRAQLQAPLEQWQKLANQVRDAIGLLELAAEEGDTEVMREVEDELRTLALRVSRCASAGGTPTDI